MCSLPGRLSLLIGKLPSPHFELVEMEKRSAVQHFKRVQSACVTSDAPQEVVREFGDARLWVIDNLSEENAHVSAVIATSNKSILYTILYRVSQHEDMRPSIITLHGVSIDPVSKHPQISHLELLHILTLFCSTRQLYIQHHDLHLWQNGYMHSRLNLEACARL
jgi:hypothetical protein